MPGGRTRAPTTQEPNGKRGRPSSLTPETVEAIVKEILKLGSYADAAISGGIHPATLQDWLSKGRKAFQTGRRTARNAEYLDFYLRIEKANQQIKGILRVRVLGDKSSKMALKVLRARWPDEWGEKVQIEDKTPQKKESPREKFMARLDQIEERQKAALAALDRFNRQVQSSGVDVVE